MDIHINKNTALVAIISLLVGAILGACIGAAASHEHGDGYRYMGPQREMFMQQGFNDYGQPVDQSGAYIPMYSNQNGMTPVSSSTKSQ